MTQKFVLKTETFPQKGKALEEYWRGIIRAWSLSGLTKAEYCREKQLSVASFHWWSREIKRRRIQRGKTRIQESPPRPSPPRPAAAFLPVVVSNAPATLPQTGWSFEVRLRNQRRIRIRPGFDPSELSQLIALTEAATC